MSYTSNENLREAIMRVKGVVIVSAQELEELRQIIEILPEVTGDFPITSVCRDDLEGYGFDIANITDDQMRELADKMEDNYCEQMFHESMKIIAENMGLPKVSKEDHSELEMAVSSAYAKHILKFGHQPKFASVRVLYKDEQNSFETYVSFVETIQDEKTDEKVFYYCRSLEDMFSLFSWGSNDFIITDVIEFFDEI